MPQGSILNLGQGEYTLEWNYINLVKRWQRVIQNQSGHAFANTWINNIDALDYPTETTVGISFLGYIPETGSYVVRWTGSGSISIANATSKSNASSGIYTGGGSDGSVVTNGRFTFSHNRGTSNVILKGTTIQNLVCCLASEEALLDAGQTFRPRFLSLIDEFSPKALRFMDAQAINTSVNGRSWAEEPSADRLTYMGSVYYPDKKLGTITGTNDYTAPSYTGMPVGYEHGEIIHFDFENSNDSATCTIDCGARGAKEAIFDYGVTPATTGTNATTRFISAVNYTAVFDAFKDKWCVNLGGGAITGSPIPVLVSMCNATARPGWFCIPFYASDAWVDSFADYLDANYEPEQVYIEFINEPWNNFTGFNNYNKCRTAGNVTMGLGTGNLADIQGYVGLRFKQIEAIMRPVLGSRLKMLLAGQGSQGSSEANLTNTVENVLFQNTSTSTSGTLGTPNENIGGANAPILVADGISYGLYYAGDRVAWLDSTWTTCYNNPPDGVTGISDVIAAADNFALGTRAGIMAAYEWLYDNFKTSMDSTTHVSTGRFALWNALAVEYDKPVLLYEVNHEFAAPSTSWCTGKSISSTYGGPGGLIDLMFQGFMNSPQYERIVSLYMKRFYALSKSEAFSLFSMAPPPPWQSFPRQTSASPDTQGGDTMQDGLGNWRAHRNSNNGYTSLQLGATV